MIETTIKVHNISKAYRIGLKEKRHDTLGAAMAAWVRSPLRNFKQLKSLSNFDNHQDEDIFWALKNINFEVKKGEVLGIIGKNGAGKSTLLKILSRITEPTSGRIEIYGRIASLLEVGTGFNPELTGRENVYLNGTILGMTKKEIDAKFDEIIDFSGVEKFIDTPVKRYSSGMKVRLAFAVAAHLESEILIVDEVLAVGDADFQKKCIGKMNDISKGEGRTVLFVSHQLGSVASLCNKGMLLNKGCLTDYGSATEIIEKYLGPDINGENINVNSYLPNIESYKNKLVFFTKGETLNSKNFVTDSFGFNEEITIKVSFTAKRDIKNIILGVGLQDKFNVRVCTFTNYLTDLIKDSSPNQFEAKITIPKEIIAPNMYSFIFALFELNGYRHDIIENVCNIRIHDTGTKYSKFEGIDYGNIILDSEWKINKL